MTPVDALGEALKADPGYLWVWQCNLAMMAVDAGAGHREANIRAADFLKSVFGADPRDLASDLWQLLEIQEPTDDA